MQLLLHMVAASSQWIPLPEADSSHDLYFWQTLCIVKSTSRSQFFTWPPLLADASSQWIPIPEADSSHELHFWQTFHHSEYHFQKLILHMTSTFGRCFVTVNSTSRSRFFTCPPLLADTSSQWIPLPKADSSHDLHFCQMLCHSEFNFRKPILHMTSTSSCQFSSQPQRNAEAFSRNIPIHV
jgi:hypothetical protein